MKSLEYLAGLFDGEGSFSIQVGLRSRNGWPPSIWFNPCMSMQLYYGIDVLGFFQESFGGSIRSYSRGGEKRGGVWRLGRHEALTIAAQSLEPYLEIKKSICARFLEALSMYPPRKGVDLMNGHRAWTPDLAVKVAEIALTLNPPRSRKCNKTLEYITEFKRSLELAHGQTVPNRDYGHTIGEKNGNSKLTLEKVAEIRGLYAAKTLTKVQLAAMYGVTQAAISHVVACRTWKASALHH